MIKVVFEYEDGTTDEIFVESISEAREYENDPDYAYIEVIG